MNLARLNHILIPKTHKRREKFRTGRAGKLLRPAMWLYRALSREGRVLALMSCFVGAAGLETDATQIYILWSALIGVLIASLLVRRVAHMDDVTVKVQVPPRVSVGEPVCFSLVLSNPAKNGAPRRRTAQDRRGGGILAPQDRSNGQDNANIYGLGFGLDGAGS